MCILNYICTLTSSSTLLNSLSKEYVCALAFVYIICMCGRVGTVDGCFFACGCGCAGGCAVCAGILYVHV